ncbi:fumarylacetoacetate hydrolase family protein [Methylocystis echinoides]|jgi:2-keto-4-pentenoate hydratase|uniref:2-keto-4-pentenoate hydratase n=1 Tax=Methylocystis echinoides TaxID=29468 RepID=UPI003421430E
MSSYEVAKAAEAARRIWSCWQAGETLGELPAECRPANAFEGYAAQAQLPEVSGRRVLGWKLAATSAVGQAHIQVSGPLAGRLLSGKVFDDGAELSLFGNRMRVAEPEFAFRMGRDLAPRETAYSQDEVMGAVADLHLGLEAPDSRFAVFEKAGEAQLIADNACAGQYVVGPAAPAVWRRIDLSRHAVTGKVTKAGGDCWTREGVGAAVLGDPRIALTWLANRLSSLGLTLKAGEIVTTGTCMTPLEIEPGDAVEADYGALGRARLRFAAEA